jgi:hypothetical protein
VSVPDHKLVPDVRIILNLGRDGVIDRGDARYLLDRGQATLYDAEQHGVALYPLGLAVIRYALTSPNDSPLDQVPLPGFRVIARTSYYAAYARC